MLVNPRLALSCLREAVVDISTYEDGELYNKVKSNWSYQTEFCRLHVVWGKDDSY